MDGKKIISGVTQPKNKRMDAFQSCVFVVTVFALLLSTVTLMRSNSNSTELFLIRERIQELEIQLSEVLVIPDSPRKLPDHTEEVQENKPKDQRRRFVRDLGPGNESKTRDKGRKGINRKIKLEIRNEIRSVIGSLTQVFCAAEERLCFGGPKGDKGEAGLQGIPGIRGETGLIGPSGPTGQKGDPGISVSIPTITTPSKVVTVQETQLTWLPCKAEGLPLPEVTWGRVYGSLPDGRHVIHNNGTIVISGTLHRDGGMYVCQAKNVLGIAKSTTLLIVHVPVRFTKKPHPVRIEEGQKAKLICAASGFPEPVITWTASSPMGRMLAHKSVKGRLVINNATLKDSDWYTCSAKNDVNELRASAQVSVLPKLKFLVQPVQQLNSFVGGRVSLLCQASSGTVNWSKKGATMPKAHNISRNGTLMINVTSVQDGGLYICAAQSEIAAINASCTLTVHVRSCSEVRLAGYNRSGVFDVKPDKDLPTFTVFCNMTDKDGVGVTVVSHSAEQRTSVAGYIYPGSYLKDVTYYGVTMAQIKHLIQASAHCEQFIKYECHHSVLLWVGSPYGWWVSRDGDKMTYWGGASPGSNMCACGMNDSCATGGACNCDANDRTWREDSGMLIDKSTLPVTQLRFGDTADPRDEKGFHTLGKFKCYGIA